MLEMNFDFGGFAQLRDDLDPDWRILQQGLIDAAAFVRDTWVAAVSGNKLPGMSRAINDDKYARSLTAGHSITTQGPLYVVVSPYGYAEGADQVERGTPAYDMKPQLLNGPKSRPLKSGNGRYNTVPFRHYTPKSDGSGASAIALRMQMPKNIFDQARRLTRSTMNPQTGKVDWGQSLQWDEPGAINSTSLYQQQTSQYAGMYRMGDAKNTQYLTFRRVSTPRTKTITRGPRKGQTVQLGSAPRSWIHPAVPANPVVQAVFDYCMPQVEKQLLAIAEQMFA